MTYQTCCGNIPSNDPNVNESNQPYMTRHCYRTDDWNLPECSKDCCGSSDATCVPTNEGGYCELDGSFYKYTRKPGQMNKELLRMSRNSALRDTTYHQGSQGPKDVPATNKYNEARYRDMKRKVLKDMRNEKMNVDIMDQRRPGDYPFLSFDYSSPFNVDEWVTPVAGVFNALLFLFIIYVLTRYLST